MKHETVRTSAFAMPLPNPAFPPSPYSRLDPPSPDVGIVTHDIHRRD
ncbi:hypothetical protein ACFFWD_34070 [Bradyrhizobium erythrophlei]